MEERVANSTQMYTFSNILISMARLWVSQTATGEQESSILLLVMDSAAQEGRIVYIHFLQVPSNQGWKDCKARRIARNATRAVL